MHYVEIIHLRMNGVHSCEPAKDLLTQALKIDQNEISQKMKIYRHQSIEGDLCVILDWKSTDTVRHHSDLGLYLTSSLKEFGRVDHTIWIEM